MRARLGPTFIRAVRKGLGRIWGVVRHSDRKALPLRTCWEAGAWAVEGADKQEALEPDRTGASCPSRASGPCASQLLFCEQGVTDSFIC